MTLSELGARMTSAEFAEWLAFEQEYGLPDAYLVTAQVCTTVARSMSGAKVGPADFVPYFQPQQTAQTGEEMAAKFRAFAAAHNRSAPS